MTTPKPAADVLARIERLELGARQVLDGLLTGSHRSAHQGFAVEFAQHREYVPGDDLKHIDWKVLGRTERMYLKQYEQETDLTAWLALDTSRSMRYGTKYSTAATAALCLGTLLVRQSDRAGLCLFDAGVRHLHRPSGQGRVVRDMAALLAQPSEPRVTELGRSLHDLAERLTRRALVLLFTDAFDDVPPLLAGLKHLRHGEHDVVLFHVLDGAEIDFPFDEPTLFRGLEEAGQIQGDPRGMRASYLAAFGAHCRDVERGCRAARCEYVLLRTDKLLGPTLAHWLATRAGGRP